MLTAYVVALIAGGVLVALSTLAGLGHDADHDLHLHADGHVDAHAAPSAAPASDLANTSLAGDAAQALTARARRTRRGPARALSTLLSLRFWSFGGCFFGLTGTALTLWGGLGEPATALWSGAAGALVGAATTWLMRRLRAPVGETRTREQWLGRSGTLLFALDADRTSKLRLDPTEGRTHELLVAPLAGDVLPAGARVVVVGIDADGRARVAAERELLGEPPRPS